MTDLAKLIVKLEAQTAQYHAELKKSNDRLAAYQRQTNSRLGAMNKRWDNFAANARRAVASLGLAVAVRKIITETTAAQNALAQLEAVVKSTGGAAGFTVPELVAMSEEFQRTTTFADDAVQSMQAVLAQFTAIAGPQFEAAQQAIVDLSARMGTDLVSSAKLVGRALQDPVKGMSALSRAGIAFDKSQTDIIKRLAETGRTAEAQQLILAELEKRFGGAAEAARNTFGGALAALGNAFNDLFELSTEGSSKATESLNRLADVLQDPAVKMAADTLFSGLVSSLAWILENAGKVAAGIAVIFNAAGDRVEQINAEIEDLQNLAASGGGLVFGDAFGESGLASIITPEEIDKQIKALVREQEALLGVGIGGMEAAKGLKAAAAAQQGLAGGTGPVGDPEALASLEKMVAALEMQIATFDKSAAAVMRYRITQGDLVETMAAAGVQSVGLGEQLVGLAARYERLQESAKRAQEVQAAGAQLEQMVEDLREQVATFGLGEAAALRYRLEHGKLSEQFALAGDAASGFKAELIALTEQQVRQQEAAKAAEEAERAFQSRVEEGQAVIDATRTATERWAAEIERLTALFREGHVDAESFNRAIVAANEELERARKEENKFAEQATRNIQDLTADFLEDLALTGKLSFDSLFEDFSRLIIRMAAQAQAAKLAEKLFGGEGVGSGGGFLDKALGIAGGFVKNLFGFGGSGAAGMDVEAGMRYRVHPGEFFAPADGRIESDSMDAMRGRSMRPVSGPVTQNIYVQGRIDQRSARQLELETLRRQRVANARLG